jgi:pimeloyl-ACP methyl ester carboxylesterase
MRAKAVRFTTADGVSLDGVEFGEGPVGAVFLHESPGDLCVWWPFAPALAKAGIHALLLDQRCFGESACPKRAKEIDPATDVEAAAKRLRKDGAKRIVLVGASYGGASALIAGSKLTDLAGVASLSGEPDLEPQLDVDKVIGHLKAPLLIAVSTGDGYVSPKQSRTMLDRAGSEDKRLIVRPRDAGHGVQLLLGDDGVTPNATFDQLVRFIRSP